MNDEAHEIEWRPLLNAERRARVDRHKARFQKTASLFRSVRERLGLTQVEAAMRLGTTQANVSKLERRPTASLAQISALIEGSDYEVVLVLRNREENLEFTL